MRFLILTFDRCLVQKKVHADDSCVASELFLSCCMCILKLKLKGVECHLRGACRCLPGPLPMDSKVKKCCTTRKV